jgi:hypothetical protein
MNTQTKPQRLFVRQLPDRLADLPTSPSTTPSLPDALRQEKFYSAALGRMEQAIPLQVATLRDQLDRVKATLERFQLARTEELTWLQLTNEDARHAEEVISEKIEALQQKRETLEAEQEARIEARMVQRALARQTAVASVAAAGLDESDLKTEFQEQDESMVLPALLESVTVTDETLPAVVSDPIPASRPHFLKGLWRGMRGQVAADSGDISPAPPASVGGTVQDENLPHRLVPEVQQEEAMLLATPREALCLKHGLPAASPTLNGLKDSQQRLEWAALVVCGTIFGISVGILIEVLDPSRLFTRPEETWRPALMVGVIGIAVFWVLGRVAHGLMSLASECWHACIATQSRVDTDAAARSLRRASIGSLFIGATLLIGLIIIEATVERYGILGALASREVNNQIQSGAATGTVKISPVVQMAMALIVSMPFLLLHGLHGWVEGKAGILNGFLASRSAETLWETKKLLHGQRTGDLAEINTDLLKYRRDELARIAQNDSTPQPVGQSVPLLTNDAVVSMSPPLQHSLIPDAGNLRLSAEQGWPLGSVAAAMLAMSQAREAHFQVRRAQAQKRESLAPLDREIQRWEAQLQMEKCELSNEAKQRIDSAHAAYAVAVRDFDALYKQECLRYESLTRPGLFWRIRHYFWAAPKN